MNTSVENNEEDDLSEYKELNGLIHFLPIVETILNGTAKFTKMDSSLSDEEFYNRYILGIDK